MLPRAVEGTSHANAERRLKEIAAIADLNGEERKWLDHAVRACSTSTVEAHVIGEDARRRQSPSLRRAGGQALGIARGGVGHHDDAQLFVASAVKAPYEHGEPVPVRRAHDEVGRGEPAARGIDAGRGPATIRYDLAELPQATLHLREHERLGIGLAAVPGAPVALLGSSHSVRPRLIL